MNSNSIIYPDIIFGTYKLNNYKKLYAVMEQNVKHGHYAFDMSPNYGTEKIIGNALQNLYTNHHLSRENFFLITKIEIIDMVKNTIEKSLDNSLKKLQSDYIDLLLIHWPYPDYYIDAWSKLEQLYAKGKCKAIGICNVQIRHLAPMLQMDIPPMVVQTEIHPLLTANNVVDFCKSHDLKVQAYSPLCKMITPIRESSLLQSLALKYGKSISQIILRWHMDCGVSPITMTSKLRRVSENLDVFNFHITQEEISEINKMNLDFHNFPASFSCPGY